MATFSMPGFQAKMSVNKKRQHLARSTQTAGNRRAFVFFASAGLICDFLLGAAIEKNKHERTTGRKREATTLRTLPFSCFRTFVLS
jgi:hypothetical protein